MFRILFMFAAWLSLGVGSLLAESPERPPRLEDLLAGVPVLSPESEGIEQFSLTLESPFQEKGLRNVRFVGSKTNRCSSIFRPTRSNFLSGWPPIIN